MIKTSLEPFQKGRVSRHDWRARLRQAVFGLLAAFASSNASASDLSDLWSDPSEPGWGLNIVQQNDVLFATLFIYDQSSRPAWYVASDIRRLTGDLTYSGALYQTSGPFFGGPFNRSAVTIRSVGTITLTLPSTTISLTSSASISIRYEVDGVSIQRTVFRQTWRSRQFASSYMGGQTGNYFACRAPADGASQRDEPARVNASLSGDTVTWRLTFGDTSTCTYTGRYQQFGRYGAAEGSVSCSTGVSGTFTATEIESNQYSFTARVLAQLSTCTWAGTVGGLNRNDPVTAAQ